MRPPQFQITFADLPDDSSKRHEVLVDLFGQYLFWIRGESLSRVRELVQSDEQRNQLGKLFREVFEQAAELDADDREVALRLAQSAVGNFASLLLTMISGQGFDDHIGPDHVFRYRLDMEVCDADTGDVVLEETINRGGDRFFPDYWGRWLNRYGKSGS